MKAWTFSVIYFLGLGMLYSYLSRFVWVSEGSAGVAACVFGAAILLGLLGVSYLVFRRK